MSTGLKSGAIWLADECAIEEAETLVGLIVQHPEAVVDISQCRLAHTAVLQVLLRFQPQLRGEFADPFLTQWVRPGLEATPR